MPTLRRLVTDLRAEFGPERRYLFLPVGIQGSGKSTLGRRLAAQVPAIVLSTDQLRLQVYGSLWMSELEPYLWPAALAALHQVVRLSPEPPNIYFDSTNLSRARRAGVLESVAAACHRRGFAPYVTVAILIRVPLRLAVQRNLARAKWPPVPRRKIVMTRRAIQRPAAWEGVERLYEYDGLRGQLYRVEGSGWMREGQPALPLLAPAVRWRLSGWEIDPEALLSLGEVRLRRRAPLGGGWITGVGILQRYFEQLQQRRRRPGPP